MTIQTRQYPIEFQALSIEDWQQCAAGMPSLLSDAEIGELLGVAHSINYSDIRAIYQSLALFLNKKIQAQRRLSFASGVPGSLKKPYVIGMTGSVSVGKSTASRFLQAFLSALSPDETVVLVPTDNFLFSNAVLEERGLMDRKGFPDSFDCDSLLRFVQLLSSSDTPLTTPIYSHHLYDIDVTQCLVVDRPDIVIMEGLNILQTSASAQLDGRHYLLSDYVDFSLYLDADSDMLLDWFVTRVLRFAKGPFKEQSAYFHELSHLSEGALMDFAQEVWLNVNLKNYKENILPYRHRANMILEKGVNHMVQRLWMR